MDEPQRRLENICMLCGERKPMPNRDICGACGSDARLLGPEADWLLSEDPDVPDWAERHRKAQESGEVFDGEQYDY